MTWSVVQTEAQREHAVRLLLMRHAYVTYLPRIKVRGRIGPLYPSYLFVNLDCKRWYPILWTPHVIRLLMAGDRPAQLPEDIVNQIRKRERNGLIPDTSRHFRKGQKVRITDGSFVGSQALFEGTSKDRVQVLLELLGQSVRVQLPEKDIAPLPVADQRGMRY